jgi:UDP-2,4-diacetamido-2,4,6-trideoxy-beta-L-altropyranose hydrolase
MIIAFRVDASDIIGTGHVYRCLNLAAQYQKYNTIYFICKNHPYNLISKIEENYQVFIINLNNFNKVNLDYNTWLGEDEIFDAKKTIFIIKQNQLIIDWLLIDHYAIQEKWENELLPFVKNIGIIDDFTNRIHHPQCKFILNQQISQEEGNIKYQNLLEKSNNQIKLYCGNDYLLLHPNYFEHFKKFDLDSSKNNNKYVINNKTNLKQIQIFMGGADTFNITEQIINICDSYNQTLHEKIKFDVIIGKSNKNKEVLIQKINNLQNFTHYYNVECLTDLLKNTDLCIGAPGSTSYERCIMNVPTLCVCVAENQKTVLNKFIESNTIKYLGTLEDNYQEKLYYYLDYLNKNSEELNTMRNNCNKLINIKNNQIKYIL